MQNREKGASPFYDEMMSRSKGQKIRNYVFKGHKLDIAKEMFGNSVFSLSNSENGINANYTLNWLKNVFSVGLYANGSFLGKVMPGKETGGLFGTYMNIPGEEGYFDAGYMRANEYGSISVKIINPKIEKVFLSKTKKKFYSCIGESSFFSKKFSLPEKSKVSKFLRESKSCIEEGMVSSSIVGRLSSSLHFGVESILSFQKSRTSEEKLSSYRTGMVHTFILEKIFSSWNVLGLIQSTGQVGGFMQKAYDDSLIFSSEVLLDAKQMLQRKKLSMEAVKAAVGLSVIGESATTRVSIDTYGTLEVVSDIQIGEGASLNISGQLLEGTETILGIGFTMTA
ncbi:hypothetical protein NEFER03_0840 [Nematocida sp. LUAm3]|nr:hypothetical protein NEFER03_0840 [Nematocida sp. LUAm3]KAI5174858.1 hypothetical protein NEFER02_0958 [Nematocida sp. LUAm2]KAI5177544.1 hypothetical protein NEFER01_0794 [Nematocida sp. LUAm1]